MFDRKIKIIIIDNKGVSVTMLSDNKESMLFKS